MGISECGTKLFSHVRSQAQLEQYAGHRLGVDLASFKLKAWYSDIAHYYRPMEPQTHGYTEACWPGFSWLSRWLPGRPAM